MTEARIRVTGDELYSHIVSVSQGDPNRKVYLGSFTPPVSIEHGIYPDSEVTVQQEDTIHTIEPGKVVVLTLENKTIEVVHPSEPIQFGEESG